MTRVLVTGAGAVIGYGVLRALNADCPDVSTVASDIYEDAAGQHFADAFEQAPYTSDPTYSDWLADVIARQRIDLIIPAIEQDVSWLADAVEANTLPPSVAVALNTPALIRLSADKGSFDHALAHHSLPCRIPTRHDGTFDDIAKDLGLPFLLKPKRGYASKGLVTVHSARDFAPYSDLGATDMIAQRIVGDASSEFTVSAFCGENGAVRALIALRRRLGPDGATAKASLVDATPFREPIETICDVFKPEGPTNFQFRMEAGKPMLLEINPRISSATSIRHAFGMNEAKMCIDHYVHGKDVKQPELRRGSAVRILQDIVSYDDRSDF
jgi:carbamoyl-phosphate synthase large subunit